MGLFWTRGYRTVQTAHCAMGILEKEAPTLLCALQSGCKPWGQVVVVVYCLRH